MIDIVITDHAMPGMTGLELAQQIQESYPAMPVILASGYAEIENGAEYGDLPRLAKPFRQLDLANAITSARAATSSTAAGSNVVPFAAHV